MNLLIPDAQRQWRDIFCAKLTAVVEVDDQFRYAWIEQALDPDTGGLMDADPARQGTTTSGYALELNNAEVSVGTQPIVMMRIRAGWNDDVVYEFDAGGLSAGVGPLAIVTGSAVGGYYPAAFTQWNVEDEVWELLSDGNIMLVGINGETLTVGYRYVAFRLANQFVSGYPLYGTQHHYAAFNLKVKTPESDLLFTYVNTIRVPTISNTQAFRVTAGPAGTAYLSIDIADIATCGVVANQSHQYLGSGDKIVNDYPNGNLVSLLASDNTVKVEHTSGVYVALIAGDSGSYSRAVLHSGSSTSTIISDDDTRLILGGGVVYAHGGYSTWASGTTTDGVSSTFSFGPTLTRTTVHVGGGVVYNVT